MLSFESDYTEGAHEKILERLMDTNRESLPGYGADRYSESAREKIKNACCCPGAAVYFLVGGTQTNAVVIDGLLGACEGVIAARTGHINVHEAGAIEKTGHKILELPEHQGKIAAGELRDFLESFWSDENHSHMVYPGMVYISHPTEYGTLYSSSELEDISSVCREYKIPLYMDGARLIYGLAGAESDVSLPDIARLCDAFYIGGTKAGALCGEAVVFTKDRVPLHFTAQIKQHGALLAKGRLLGIQFDTLFTDRLYEKIGLHAAEMAGRLKEGLKERGYSFYLESPTNQQFVILTKEQYERLKKHVAVSFWEQLSDSGIVVRFAVSWATRQEDLEALWEVLDRLKMEETQEVG